jgi:CubicO group peptidase (beta-lactamase class C family)
LPANAAVPPDLETRARAIVEEERAIGGTLAMSVAIFADGQVIALFATGLADVEAKIPATSIEPADRVLDRRPSAAR